MTLAARTDQCVMSNYQKPTKPPCTSSQFIWALHIWCTSGAATAHGRHGCERQQATCSCMHEAQASPCVHHQSWHQVHRVLLCLGGRLPGLVPTAPLQPGEPNAATYWKGARSDTRCARMYAIVSASAACNTRQYTMHAYMTRVGHLPAQMQLRCICAPAPAQHVELPGPGTNGG